MNKANFSISPPPHVNWQRRSFSTLSRQRLKLLATIVVLMLTAGTRVDAQLGGPYYPIAHWDFNNAISTVVDVSGNGHNGTIFNCTPVVDCQNNPNSALHFNGTNSWIQVPSSPAFCTGEWTINIIFKPTGYNRDPATCQYSGLLMHEIPGHNDHYSVSITDDPIDLNCGLATTTPNSRIIAEAGGPAPGGINAGASVTLNRWHCFTVVYRNTAAFSSRLEYFIDGSPVSSFAWPYTFDNLCSPMDLFIGRGLRAGLDTWFEGDIDDIQIYLNAMSAADVRQYLPCPCGGVVIIEDPEDDCGIADIKTTSSTSSPFSRTFQASVTPSGNWVQWYVNGSPTFATGSIFPYTYVFPGAGSYTVCAVAFNPLTNTPCDTLCFESCICQTGMRQPTKIKEQKFTPEKRVGDLFPNPANTELSVPIQGYSGQVKIDIRGLDGTHISSTERQLKSGELIKIDIAKLVPGTYFTEVHLGNDIVRKKFVRR